LLAGNDRSLSQAKIVSGHNYLDQRVVTPAAFTKGKIAIDLE
jgi:hypothetical protein